MLLAVVLGGGVGVVPPLTADQRKLVEQADDAALIDQPALMGLLRNVMEWDGTASGEGSGQAVDLATLETITADPGPYRGELFSVVGQYAGRQRDLKLLRPGPWGEALKEWGLVVGAGRSDSGRVAMVYLVDPDGELVTPRQGTHMRVAARFFMVWTDQDADGNVTRYPVFVGRSAVVVAAEGGAGAAGSTAVIVGAVVAMLAGLFWVRRMGKGAGGSKRQAVLQRMREDARRYEEEAEEAGDEAEALPQDPAEALDALSR